MSSPELPMIRYGAAALADVMPSALAALGVANEPNPLEVADTPRIVVLLVDGLGWPRLTRNAAAAPFLNSLTGRSLTAGFPTTTVSSLASLGTGLTTGQHGLTGYTSYLPDVDTTINWLSWRPAAGGDSLIDVVVPEVLQPQRTVFERAEAAGVAVTIATGAGFGGSGLTRAVLRGGRFDGTVSGGDLISRVADASRTGNRSLVYGYVSEMDLIGHVRGPDSDAWLAQLTLLDRFVEQFAAALPADATLLITADHGMTTVPEPDKVDYDEADSLRDGVLALAGEPRARYVHARPGAQADVFAAWHEQLSDRMWVLSRDDAIAAGLFGPSVAAASRERIGDVVAISRGTTAVVRRRMESRLSGLPGQHGALTDDDLLVPLLRAGRT
ncbi:MAG: alkaline phosphatase family protein [Pseudonocardiales bacterium]|nr:MAG: alkaline phosphatase family protein [Pseudonocardiales bacterium]